MSFVCLAPRAKCDIFQVGSIRSTSTKTKRSRCVCFPVLNGDKWALNVSKPQMFVLSYFSPLGPDGTQRTTWPLWITCEYFLHSTCSPLQKHTCALDPRWQDPECWSLTSSRAGRHLQTVCTCVYCQYGSLSVLYIISRPSAAGHFPLLQRTTPDILSS